MRTLYLPIGLLIALAVCGCDPQSTSQQASPVFVLDNPHSTVTLASGSNDNVFVDNSYSLLDVVPTSPGSSITGFDHNYFGDSSGFLIHNVHASLPVTLVNESTSSSSGNRLSLPGARDILLAPRASAWVIRDDNVGSFFVIAGDEHRVTSVQSPSRSFNTTFTPSTTRPVQGHWSVRIVSSLSLTTGAAGRVELRVDTSGTPSTVRARCAGGSTGTLAVGLAIQDISECELTYIVAANENVRLVPVDEVGTPAYTITLVMEEIL